MSHARHHGPPVSGSADVVVVGAGVVGLSAALFLADAGARVLVLERESLACGASGAAAGIVSPFAEVEGPEALDRLAEAGVGLHRLLVARLRDETGIDVVFRPLVVLRPALADADETRLRASATARAATGVEWVDRAAALALEPRLTPRVRGALVASREFQVDPYRLCLALARAVEQRDVEIRYTSALGLARQGRRVLGVRVPHGCVEAERVVLAAGPWTGLMQAWVEWPLPVSPLRGQIVYLQALAGAFHCCLMRGGNYVLPKEAGVVLAGTTEERVGFRTRATRAAQRAILAGALLLAPSLRDATVVRQTACLRPLSADGLPLLGAVPGWENLFVATGHGRRGILLGPISGQVVADLVLGRAPRLPIGPFDPARLVQPVAA